MDTKYFSEKEVLNLKAKDIIKYTPEQVTNCLRTITGISDIMVREMFIINDFDSDKLQIIYHHCNDTRVGFGAVGENFSQIVKEIIDNKIRVEKARYEASKRTIQDIMYGLVQDLKNSVFEINGIEDYISFKQALYEMDNIVLSHFRKENFND